MILERMDNPDTKHHSVFLLRSSAVVLYNPTHEHFFGEAGLFISGGLKITIALFSPRSMK